MRGFMVLCLAAVAVAAPQGYNYQPTTSFHTGSSGLSVGSPVVGSAGTFGVGSSPVFGGNFGSHGQVTIGAPSAGVQFVTGGPAVSTVATGTRQTFVQQPAVVEYSKNFYFHDAPEDNFDDNQLAQELASTLKKNLNVVFIKAPENKGLQNAALQLVKQSNEEKTAIYVLSKQADLSELRNQVQQIQSTTQHKPEVHFVKYRTPEEAEHAQHAIQAQYDSLGGSSQSSHEGVAPVVNYAGSVSGPQVVTSTLGVPQVSSTSHVVPQVAPQVTVSAVPSSSYLPAIVRL